MTKKTHKKRLQNLNDIIIANHNANDIIISAIVRILNFLFLQRSLGIVRAIANLGFISISISFRIITRNYSNSAF